MVYQVLFIVFVLFFLYDLFRRKESVGVAAVMGLVLFLLVAFRASSVGPDTQNYIQLYYTGVYGEDFREMEGFFLAWNSFWRNLYFNGQMYLVVCAIASVGLILFCMWKSSQQRVWTYVLFLVAFSWYFYLSGIRQSLAMGCFTMGVYLLNRNIDILSFGRAEHKDARAPFSVAFKAEMKRLFHKENLGAAIFLIVAPFFHMTALFALAMLVLVLLVQGNRTFYIVAISVSFIVALTAVFKSAEQLIDNAFSLLSGDSYISTRYAGYLDDEYIYDTSLYLVLKSCLPVNFIALLALFFRNRRYRLNERLFFWMVIIQNLFFYFSYMFRMNMYLYPFACIAIANLLSPVLIKKKIGVYHIIMAIYVILCAYVSYTNLTAQPEFIYNFCF